MSNYDKTCDLLIVCYENTMLKIPFQVGKFYPIYYYSLRKGYAKCNKKFVDNFTELKILIRWVDLGIA